MMGFGKLFSVGPRTASIVTREPTELLRIDRAQFHEVLRASKLQEMARKQGFLRTHPCFHVLPEDVLKKFVDNAVIKSYKPAELIIKVGEEKVDHVIIVMSGECYVMTDILLNKYKLNDGKFLLDLPSVKRPEIERIRSHIQVAASDNQSTTSSSTVYTKQSSSCRQTCASSVGFTSHTTDYSVPSIATQSVSPYGRYFNNDVKEVNEKPYRISLRRIKAKEYFNVSDCIANNRCNVHSVKKTECLLLPKILFQKYNMTKILDDMLAMEEASTLSIEEAFATFLRRRHWDIYKKKLVSDVLRNNTRQHRPVRR